jgi:hypothetical protein
MAAIVQPSDLTAREMLIIENAWRILDGTHPLAGPEWTPVTLMLARAAWRELITLRERA